MVLSWNDAVDIGYGRGRLAREAAESLSRVDAALGRPADINEAWRSPEQANANYARYLAYLAGRGPWAPIALPADQSVHCIGYAVDTDDTADWQMSVWNDHGWFWTVYRNGQLVERWHLEYDRDRDNHRNQPASVGGSTPFTPAPVEPPKRKKRTMINAAWQDENGTIAVQAVPGGKVTLLTDPREWAGIAAATGAEAARVKNDELQQILQRYGQITAPAFDTSTGAAAQIVVPLDGASDRYQVVGDRVEWINGDQLQKLLDTGARTVFLARDQIDRMK